MINRETDPSERQLMTIQKEAVLAIQKGTSPWLLHDILNSYIPLLKKEEKCNPFDTKYFPQGYEQYASIPDEVSPPSFEPDDEDE